MGHRGADPPCSQKSMYNFTVIQQYPWFYICGFNQPLQCSTRYLPLKRKICVQMDQCSSNSSYSSINYIQKNTTDIYLSAFYPTLLNWLLYSRSFLRLYFMLIFYKENYVIWKNHFFAMFHYLQLPVWCSVAVILLLILRGKSIQVFTIKYGVSCTFR